MYVTAFVFQDAILTRLGIMRLCIWAHSPTILQARDTDQQCTALRLADQENLIRELRQQQHHRQQSSSSSRSDEHPPNSAPPAQTTQIGLSRFGSFMRKASFNPSTEPSPSAREQELEASLIKEQTARIAAETKVKEVNLEVEELSTSLFEQANNMVAHERRENAGLREKIKELEAAGGDMDEAMKRENERLKQKLQTLEQRMQYRDKRLEKLEAAQKRIERVRTMLAPR